MTTTMDQPVLRNVTSVAIAAQELLGKVKTESIGSVQLAPNPAPALTLTAASPEMATVVNEPVAQATTPQEAVKTTNETQFMPTKSGDTWFNIQLPGATPAPANSNGSTLTPEEKNKRGIVIAAIILVVLILAVWLMNRKK